MENKVREYFQIKDSCRKGLIKYLEKVCSRIAGFKSPKILDTGCGTGVPTLWIAENYAGTITAIDTDGDSIEWLNHKIALENLQDRVRTFVISFFDFKSAPDYYDIVLAEGFLNAIGFENGFTEVIKILKRHGYFIIHDEFKDHQQKRDFILNLNCKIFDTLSLGEDVWWNDYYRQLEIEINTIRDEQLRKHFLEDIQEIECYKADPTVFKSIYYLVQKL